MKNKGYFYLLSVFLMAMYLAMSLGFVSVSDNNIFYYIVFGVNCIAVFHGLGYVFYYISRRKSIFLLHVLYLGLILFVNWSIGRSFSWWA